MMQRLFLGFSLAIATLLSLPQVTTPRELSEIEADGKIKIAVKDNARPLGFIDPEGNLVGLEIDLARKLAEELVGDLDAVELTPVMNPERLQVVLNDQVDLAIAKVGVTTPRARIVDFSPYYYLDSTSIVTNQKPITKIDDLATQKIAVLKNSATIAIIRHRLPAANLVGVESYQEALQLLETKQVQGFAGDRSLLVGWVQEDPNYKLLPTKLSGSALAVVMPRGLQYQELRQQVEQAITKLKESGWLAERIEYWGL